jgi:hypothetical protein
MVLTKNMLEYLNKPTVKQQLDNQNIELAEAISFRMKNMPLEYQEVVNEHFWDLLD